MKLLLYAALLLFLLGCETEPTLINRPVDYEKVAWDCVGAYVRIDTPQAYDSLYDSVLVASPGAAVDCERPTINFDQLTLLGKVIATLGCSPPTVEHNVLKNEQEKTLTFSSYLETYGDCERIHLLNEWVLVEKLPSDYVVRYVMTEHNHETD